MPVIAPDQLEWRHRTPKSTLDGHNHRKFGKGGKELKEFMPVHELEFRTDEELYAAESRTGVCSS
jgi:hypothetical protein